MNSTQTPSSGLLESVLVYISAGGYVLPLWPIRDGKCLCGGDDCKPGKHPIGHLVPRGHLDATNDPARAATWWGIYPDANVGLALGKSGLIDVAPDSIDWHASFLANGLPPTMHFASGGGRGHEHWLYNLGDLPQTRIAHRGQYDILSDGYAVMPPSVHESGEAYRWLDWLPTTTPPDWLREFVVGYVQERNVPRSGEVVPSDTDVPPLELNSDQTAIWNGDGVAVPGGRSNGLVDIARVLGEGGFSDVERIASILAERDVSLGWHKYSGRRDGREYRKIAERYGHPQPRVQVGSIGRQADEADQVVLYAPPPFPRRVLPLPLRALCDESSLPTALLAGAGLGTLAIAVGGDAEIVVNRSHVERSIVFVPLIGPKSVGKSPSMEMATRPLVMRNDLVWDRYLAEVSEWNALSTADKKTHPRPVDPRIYAGDATSSAMLRHMAVRRDISRILHEMRQTLFYDRDRQAHLDTGLLLQLWSGNSASYTRTGTGRGGGNDVDLYVSRPTCSILGDLQPKFHYLLGQDDDGMRPRWLPHVWTERFIGQRRYPSDDALDAWDDLIHALLKRREGLDRVGLHLQRQWTLSDVARSYLEDRVLDWMQRSDNAENTSYQAGLTKAEANLLRVGLILAEAEAPDIRTTVVSREILERAAEWVEYSLACWLSLGSYEQLSLTPLSRVIDPAIVKLREYIETQGDVDPQTGRRHVRDARILDNGVAGATNKAKRDALVVAYGLEYPGCVEDVKLHGKGRDYKDVWAPLRRGWDTDLAPPPPPEAPRSGSPDPDLGPPNTDLGSQIGVEDSQIGVENEPIEPDRGSETAVQTVEIPVEKPDDALTRARRRASRASAPPTQGKKSSQARAYAREYALTKSEADFGTILDTLTACEAVGVDCETTTLHHQQGGRIRTLQLASPDRVYVVDLDAIPDWRSPLRAFLRDRDGPRLVFQEAVFDLGWLTNSGLPFPRWQRLFDVRLAARVTEKRGGPGYKYDLKTLAQRYLKVNLPKEYQTSDWSQPTLSDDQLQYAANDAAILLDLYDRLVVDLNDQNAWAVFSLEHQVLRSMVWMREAGAPVDVPLLHARVAEAIALRDQKLADLHALAGTVQEVRPPNGLRKKDPPRADNEMNWGSVDQLKVRLNLESTRKQFLLQLDPLPPVVEGLLAWRGATRLAAYGEQLLNEALIGDRIYGSFDSLGAATGRMSCRTPNLQQMHRGRHYRETICAPPGETLVKVDYNALQMRIAADISGDQALIDLFNAGGDPHTLTAEQVLNDVEGRQTAKSINFGLLFGSSAATLRTTALTGYGVRMSLEEAKQYRSAFFSLYPGLLAWHQKLEHKRAAPLNVEDPSGSGRVRRQVLAFNERINTPVQMVEVHGMKRAMRDLHARRNEHPYVKFILSVHDELVVQCPIDKAAAVADWLEEIMRNAMSPLLDRVPIVTEATIHPRWWKPKADTVDTLLDGEADDE